MLLKSLLLMLLVLTGGTARLTNQAAISISPKAVFDAGLPKKEFLEPGGIVIPPVTPPVITPVLDETRFGHKNYGPSTDFNMVEYFKGLWEYSPINDAGSCGYVSLIQLMSYYDTFFNDNIIPEKYDRHKAGLSSANGAKLSSPGVLRQGFTSAWPSYEDFCYETRHDNLQSELTCIQNSLNPSSEFNPKIHGSSYDDLLLSFHEGKGIYSYVEMFDGLGNPSGCESFIDAELRKGKPVIVHICSELDEQNRPAGDYHSVVVYEKGADGYYANFGYGKEQTHLPLLGGPMGYKHIAFAFVVDYSSNPHVHSNNYCYSNKEMCGCNTDDLALLENDIITLDSSPTIYWMKGGGAAQESFEIKLLDDRTMTEHFVGTTAMNSVTFKKSLWKTAISSCRSSIFFVLQRTRGGVEHSPFITAFPKPLA